MKSMKILRFSISVAMYRFFRCQRDRTRCYASNI